MSGQAFMVTVCLAMMAMGVIVIAFVHIHGIDAKANSFQRRQALMKELQRNADQEGKKHHGR